jgi:hypothetical protein
MNKGLTVNTTLSHYRIISKLREFVFGTTDKHKARSLEHE